MRPDNILINKAGIRDVSLLQKIARETFYETFSADNTEADMQYYLENNFSEKRMMTELSNAESHFYLARAGGAVAGYLKINSGNAQTERQPGRALEIERIYVLSDFHGRAVGQLLLEKALELATEQNAEFIWLGVWEHNAKAIRFYEKNGFAPFGKHLFRLGDDEQTDVLMRRSLVQA